jgi:hypothetical protein
LTAFEERQLEPQATAFVPCVAVLVLLGCVAPAVGRQQRGNPTVVVQLHRDVEVIVRSRDQARVKIDRPTAEQPVVDPLAVEQLMNPGQRSELLRLAHAVSFRRATLRVTRVGVEQRPPVRAEVDGKARACQSRWVKSCGPSGSQDLAF